MIIKFAVAKRWVLKKTKIAHLTSVHPRFDTRIFLKECTSLAEAGFSVSLVVADDKGDSVKNGVHIFDVGASKGRLNRITKTTKRVFDKALELDCEIYHLHDPELIPIGLKLKRLGRKVIFDAHEDVPKQILGKPYLNTPVKWMLSKSFGVYEAWACKHFDAIITATPYIRNKFSGINTQVLDVNNYPMLGELESASSDWGRKRNEVCYVGGISEIRGIRELVRAMELVRCGAFLMLGGKFSEKDIECEVKGYPGWNKVNELGWLDRDGVRNVLNHSKAGLVTLHPSVNYLDALPVKMFEYMSAGIPVIASKFPLWQKIIEGYKCGICVDPLCPKDIAHAIDYVMSNPGKAKEMGGNGMKAVSEYFNWDGEKKKLIDLYECIS